MGRRSRQGGLANAALRAARAAAQARDDELARIAENVYAIGQEVKESGGTKLPLAVYAPLRAAVELASIPIVRTYRLAEALGVDEAEARVEFADYMVAWFVELTAALDVKRFVEWSLRMRSLERGEAYVGNGEPAAPSSTREGEPRAARERGD